MRPDAATTGLGLSNARERLQLICGHTASLTLEPDDAHRGFVVASVSTPLLEREASPEREALMEREASAERRV